MANSFIYILSVVPSQYDGIVELVQQRLEGPQKLKDLWPFTKKLCQSLNYNNLETSTAAYVSGEDPEDTLSLGWKGMC